MKISKRLNNIMNEFFKNIPNEYTLHEKLDRFSFALLLLMSDEKDDSYNVTLHFDKFWILNILDIISKTSKINKRCDYTSYIPDLDTLKPYLADNALLIYFIRRTMNALFYLPFDYRFLYSIMRYDRDNFKFISDDFRMERENNIRTRFIEYFLYDCKEGGLFEKRGK